MKGILDYTAEEKKKLAAGMWSHHCPKCGHFWLRDYGYPIRHCPACNTPKPWADKDLI